MLALEKWAQGRFKPMAMLAQIVAVSARDCHKMIHQSRAPWLLASEEAMGINPAHWTKLYRRPGRMEGEMLQFLFAPGPCLHRRSEISGRLVSGQSRAECGRGVL